MLNKIKQSAPQSIPMAEITILELPKWGLSMEEGTVVRWLIAEGERFAEGDELCEIEASKFTNVLEATFSGRIARILAPEGTNLAVSAPLALCAEAEVEAETLDAFAANLPGVEETSSRDTEPAATPEPATPLSDAPETPTAPKPPAPSTTAGGLNIPASLLGSGKAQGPVTPHAADFAAAHGIDLSKITGSGRQGRIAVADIEQAIRDAGGSVPARAPARTSAQTVPTTAAASAIPDSMMRASPQARAYAAAHDIPLAACSASDPRGRITLGDVQAAQARGFSRDGQNRAPMAPVEAEEITLSSMRKAIGQRLQASKRDAPHFRVEMAVEIDTLMALRKALNERLEEHKTSINDFIIKACAEALIAVPEVNVQFDGTILRRLKRADIAVAVALDSGLITPLIRAAETKDVVEISLEMKALAEKARAGRLTPDEVEGGSFTISNLGMFGVSRFDAVINPPQAAILAVGGGEKFLLPGEAGPRTATRMTLTLASEHRVIDGALAARFLGQLRAFLQNPGLMGV